MKTAEEAAAAFLCKLQAAIDLSEYKDGEVNLLVQGFKKGFESGKAEGFESRQGEVDALKAELLKLYQDWKNAVLQLTSGDSETIKLKR